MKFSLKSRPFFLAITLVGTILLAIFAPKNEESIGLTQNTVHVIDKSKPRSDQSAQAEKTFQNSLLPIKRSTSSHHPGELFLVNRVRRPHPLAIELPAAPPLPFSYMGRIIENGKLTVFLTRDDKTYAISTGETIDHQYMVDAITAQRIDFTYIPLGQKQTMMTGAN